MTDDLDTLLDRRDENKAKVHSDLTETARERLAHVTSPSHSNLREHYDAVEEIVGKRGYSPLTEELELDIEPTEILDWFGESYQDGHNHLIFNADTVTALAYLELVLWKSWSHHNREPETMEAEADRIEEVLENEGILWELKYDGDGHYRFEEIAHERMQEADEELRGLMMGTKWEEPLKGYNKAYGLYLNRKYGTEIPENLYNSIEAVVTKICVDLERWEENPDRNLSHYLELLREHDLFAPNNIMKAEIGDMARSMEKTFSKVGADRKNRHSNYMDRYYCSMLLHQVSAYLVFIIKRYEQKFEDESN